jgi:hypothetical protein
MRAFSDISGFEDRGRNLGWKISQSIDPENRRVYLDVTFDLDTSSYIALPKLKGESLHSNNRSQCDDTYNEICVMRENHWSIRT